MDELPSDLLACLPEGTGPVAERWWNSLSAIDRRAIAGLWDARLEVRFFAPQSNEAGSVDEWDQVPAVTGGRFVPHDDDGRGEWAPGYFEHLLQHPELIMAYEPVRRTFHIGCTRHPEARACLAAKAVPITFSCPIGSVSCPLHKLRGSLLTNLTNIKNDEPKG